MAGNKLDVVVVPARAGSKGIKNKNLIELNGLPLFERAVKQGCEHSSRVILSTDIPEILSGGIFTSAEIHARSSQTAEDSATMEDVLLEVIHDKNLLNCNVLLLQPTSPLRKYCDISGAISLFLANETSLVVSCCRTSSGILKSIVGLEGKYFGIRNQEYLFQNRQNLPPLFKPNGAIFIFNSKVFLECGFNNMPLNVFEMPEERSLDIDNEYDLEMARDILKHG